MSDELEKAVFDCNTSEFLGTNISCPNQRELPGVKLGVSQEHVVSKSQTQRGVADELEPLIRRRLVVRGVSQSFFEKGFVSEAVVKDTLHGDYGGFDRGGGDVVEGDWRGIEVHGGLYFGREGRDDVAVGDWRGTEVCVTVGNGVGLREGLVHRRRKCEAVNFSFES